METEYCPDLERQLENFYSDPMTQAYGAQDCSEIIVNNHIKRCKKCKELNNVNR